MIMAVRVCLTVLFLLVGVASAFLGRPKTVIGRDGDEIHESHAGYVAEQALAAVLFYLATTFWSTP